jgi:hypothetical protein
MYQWERGKGMPVSHKEMDLVIQVVFPTENDNHVNRAVVLSENGIYKRISGTYYW